LALAYWFLAIAAFIGCALTFVLLRKIRLSAEPDAPTVETHVVLPFCFNATATGALADAVLGEPAPATNTAPP
jgi:hypothetical protein